jgi:hypothetical protein
MSYMNRENACLVGYRLVPTADSPVYGTAALGIDSHWAEPDVDEAAGWLRKLADDPAARERIGRAAADGALRYQQQAERLGFLDDLLALQAQGVCRDPADRQRLRRQALEARDTFHSRGQSAPGRIGRDVVARVKTEFGRRIGWRLGRR